MDQISAGNQPAPQLLSSTFIVRSSHLNHEDALSVCKILEAITALKDEAIIQLLGTLDYSRIILEHFYLDFIGKAALHDMVTFQSHTNRSGDDMIELSVSAHKSKGKWQVPIVNGSFVFAVKAGIETVYSLS